MLHRPEAETTLFLQIKAASQLSPSGIWHWLSDSGGRSGTSLALTLPYEKSGDELKKQASEKSLHLQILKESEKDVTVLMSCSSMPVQDFIPACELLKSVVLD